ncbi:MAG: hypothetical protein KAR64_09965 [Thermoplasmatales archaeon]|nr:hypothetical protein [Thermoplasmatales archaeon]
MFTFCSQAPSQFIKIATARKPFGRPLQAVDQHPELESKGFCDNNCVDAERDRSYHSFTFIKTAFKRSYGFKTEKYRNTMIYLVAGKLDLPTRC